MGWMRTSKLGQAGRRAAAAALALLALAAGAPAQARWLRADTPHFVVFSNGDEHSLRDYAGQLEKFDALLRLLHDIPSDASPTRLNVYLLSGKGALRQVYPDMPGTVAGFYYADPDGVQAFAERYGDPSGWYDATDLIFHEYVHHFVAQYFSGYFPTWVNEGLAEYYGGTKFVGEETDLGMTSAMRLAPLLHNDWMPIKDLISRRKSIDKGPHAEMYYPEAWLAVHYAMRDPVRSKQLAAFIKAVRGGEPAEAAFTRCFQTDPAGFQKALWRYLDKASYSHGKLKLPPAPEIRVAPLPPSADRLLLLAAHIRKGAANAQDRAKVLEAARAGAVEFPDDPLALKTLAQAEMKFGELEKADAPLDKLLAAHPDDVEAQYLKGRRWMIAGRRDPEHRSELWDKARIAFAAVYRLDQNYYPAIYYSGLSRADEPGRPSDNTVAVLQLAHDLAPQVDEISMAAARVMMRRERYADVVALLEPIAYAPHPGKWMERAQAMLETARMHLPAPGETAATPPAPPSAPASPEH